MNVNVNYLKINFYESGSVEFRINSPERMKIDNYHSDYPSSYYLSKYDLQFALDCMTGKSTSYPYFDDLSYLLKFYTDGIKVIEISDNRPCKSLYFTFPLSRLDNLHAMIERHIALPFNDTLEFTQSDFNLWDKLYHPRCKFILEDLKHSTYNPETFDFITTIEISIAHKIGLDIKSNPELKNNLQSLIRIAHNYSTFGDMVLINLSFDSYSDSKNNPSSYYFDIRLDDKRIMNGGIIAHKHNNGFEYSMHT